MLKVSIYDVLRGETTEYVREAKPGDCQGCWDEGDFVRTHTLI